MKIQEYLDANYSTNREKRELRRLIVNNKGLTDELNDLSNFPNLEEIDLGANNSIHGHLSVFSNLIKLKELRINGDNNNFSGSLSDLNGLNLKYLDISGNKEIEGDINDLSHILKTFRCRKTVFSRVMKLLDYDLEAWRLAFRPQLFTEEEWERKIDKEISDTTYYLSIVGDNLNSHYNSLSNYISRFRKKELQKNSKVAFLKSILLEKENKQLKEDIEYLEINLNASHPDLMDADKVSWYSKIYPELYAELKGKKGERRIELSDFVKLLVTKNQELKEQVKKLQSNLK